MTIYIDIDRAIGWDGKAVAYYATPHWNIDEQDTIDPKDIDLMVKNVADIINKGLSNVQTKKNIKKEVDKFVEDWSNGAYGGSN